MAIAQNRLIAGMWRWLHSDVGVRFIRFIGVAVVSLATSEILLGLCDGVFRLPAIPTALISTLSGAAVSYVLSRWAWERKGRPDLLRETVPFWIISGVVWVVLTLATKLGYELARSMHLHGARHVLVVGLTYFAANLITFLLRFVIFHYVLFTDRTAASRAAASAPGTDETPVASPAGVLDVTGTTEAGPRSDGARATRCQEPRA